MVGLMAAALLAVGLGVFIPRQVERHMLRAQADSNQQVLEALLASQVLPVEDLASDFEDLDRFVGTAVLRGDFVRVKLWAPDGRILYSDDRRLVGRRFPPSPELVAALAGEVRSELSDLSEPENRIERSLADRLMEFYFPVEQNGRVVAVWEVYQSLDRFEARLGRVRVAVWASVGTGLGVLLVFLVSSFGSLLAAIQQRRRLAEERARDLAALLEVSRAVSESLDAGYLSQATVRVIQREGGFRAVALIRRGPTPSVVETVAVSGDRACAERCVPGAEGEVPVEEGDCASFSVRLGSEDKGLLLIACRDAARGISEEDRTLLATAGEQVRIALENARLYESLQAARRDERELTRRLVTAHEDERKRIVGEIHDGLGQDLHRVLFGLRGCRSSTPEEAAEELERLEGIVADSVGRLRRLLQDLRPSTLEDVGLAGALRGLAERVRREEDLRVELRGDRLISPEPPLPVRVAVFRIAQEALRNAVRHSGSSRAVVEVARDDGELTLRVSDEGGGMPAERRAGLGLWLMRERAEALGGTLSVRSGAAGTIVTAVIPLQVQR